MDDIKSLVEKIKQCNLPEADKKKLLEKLEKPTPDVDGFLKTLAIVLKVSNEVLKLFDLDIGELF